MDNDGLFCRWRGNKFQPHTHKSRPSGNGGWHQIIQAQTSKVFSHDHNNKNLAINTLMCKLQHSQMWSYVNRTFFKRIEDCRLK